MKILIKILLTLGILLDLFLLGDIYLVDSTTSFKAIVAVEKWKTEIIRNYRIRRDNLEGHWHMFSFGKNPCSVWTHFHTLDFDEYSQVALGNGEGVFWSARNPVERTIFSYECVNFQFGYHLDDGVLFLTRQDGEIREKYIAFRCEADCCDKQKDFFYEVGMDIDLPIATDDDCVPNANRVLNSHIYCGITNDQDSCGAVYGLVFSDRRSDVDDLPMWEEREKSKLPERDHPKMRRIIFADKNAPMSMLLPIFEFYRERNMSHLFIARRDEDKTTDFKICLKAVDFTQIPDDTDVEMTVGEWLGTQVH